MKTRLPPLFAPPVRKNARPRRKAASRRPRTRPRTRSVSPTARPRTPRSTRPTTGTATAIRDSRRAKRSTRGPARAAPRAARARFPGSTSRPLRRPHPLRQERPQREGRGPPLLLRRDEEQKLAQLEARLGQREDRLSGLAGDSPQPELAQLTATQRSPEYLAAIPLVTGVVAAHPPCARSACLLVQCA